MRDADLPAVCVLKMHIVMAAIRRNAQTAIGVKTKNVHRKKELHIALRVKKIVKRACSVK